MSLYQGYNLSDKGMYGPMDKRVVIIVAHPDDEVIWCGGMILRHPDWDWTVLCLSRSDDADRCPKFTAACNLLGVTGYIDDLDDSCPLELIDRQREIDDRVMNSVGVSEWDLCITHGPNGEYGHLRHVEIHEQVLELVRNDSLQCDELWSFAYNCNPRTNRCRASYDVDITVELTEKELAEKKRIIHELYGYGCGSFEYKACISPETFRRRKLKSQETVP